MYEDKRGSCCTWHEQLRAKHEKKGNEQINMKDQTNHSTKFMIIGLTPLCFCNKMVVFNKIMGLLIDGDILKWTELKRKKNIIKSRGIQQFLNAYTNRKDNTTDCIAFGDEVELMIVLKVDNKYKLYCGSEKILAKLTNNSVEYGRYMIEIRSDIPLLIDDLHDLESKMIEKCNAIEDISDDDIKVLAIPCFPNLCYKRFHDDKPLSDDVTLSLHFPDNAICQHKRFTSFTENARNRRGRKIEGYVQVMPDTHTAMEAEHRHILIDSMGQGMGCCGTQTTIQASNLNDARYMYDMMGVLGPLLLRLSRGAPCANGKLLNTETRWDMIEMSVDCRTDHERGYVDDISGTGSRYDYGVPVPKSRFSPLDLFISDHKNYKDSYNDIHVPIHTQSYTKLKSAGIDTKLAKHVASLFIRDPIMAYKNTDEDQFEDFENIQSSNWRSVRLKLPCNNMEQKLQGWKVEVRTMDVQATAFENTTIVYFTFLLSQAILKYNLNLYIPVSKVDANYIRANAFTRRACEYTKKLSNDKQVFYYRENVEDADSPIIKEGTLQEIFLGTDQFKGLLFYIYKLLDEHFVDQKSHFTKYIEFVRDKIDNKYICLSDYIRKFVINHETYKNDSVVSDAILDDLIDNLLTISKRNSIEYLKN